MSSNKITVEELAEIKKYVKKKIKKLKKEGSTTAGVPGYMTPAAFTGEEGGEGTNSLDLSDDQYAYSEKPSKEKRNFIKIHEASYKEFKTDPNLNEIQKVNRKVLEVSRMLREISRSLDHSLKLKTESSLGDSAYWKRTNEAILKINKRLGEVTKKAKKLANLKELTATSIKSKLVQVFNKAGMHIEPQDVDYHEVGTNHYEFDIMIHGEPHAIDFVNDNLIYQSFDKEIPLGNINQEQSLVQKISQTF